MLLPDDYRRLQRLARPATLDMIRDPAPAGLDPVLALAGRTGRHVIVHGDRDLAGQALQDLVLAVKPNRRLALIGDHTGIAVPDHLAHRRFAPPEPATGHDDVDRWNPHIVVLHPAPGADGAPARRTAQRFLDGSIRTVWASSAHADPEEAARELAAPDGVPPGTRPLEEPVGYLLHRAICLGVHRDGGHAAVAAIRFPE